MRSNSVVRSEAVAKRTLRLWVEQVGVCLCTYALSMVSEYGYTSLPHATA